MAGQEVWQEQRVVDELPQAWGFLRPLGVAVATSEHPFEPLAAGAFTASRFPGLVVLVQPWGSFILEFWGVCHIPAFEKA